MKNSKLRRILLLVACAVLLVSLSVGATLAYLTSTTGTVKNTFTVGNVNIKLDEAKVDEYGKTPDGRTEEGNEYKLLPGHVYAKDPTVTVLGTSEACYVRIVLKITNYDKLQAILGADVLPQDLVNGTWDNASWPCASYEVKGNVATCEFRYKEVVERSKADTKLPALFTQIKIDGAKVNENNIGTLKDVEIQIQAHAIQADGFDDAAAAWAAYSTQKAN